ncbi:MAG: hypothetical protein F6K41_23865 [Symploca sp. SIO3E6]|nr:hypothetical protein [Caldora sp. SIO3E6]
MWGVWEVWEERKRGRGIRAYPSSIGGGFRDNSLPFDPNIPGHTRPTPFSDFSIKPKTHCKQKPQARASIQVN